MDYTRSIGAKVDFEEGSGGHDWTFWVHYLQRGLEWLFNYIFVSIIKYQLVSNNLPRPIHSSGQTRAQRMCLLMNFSEMTPTNLVQRGENVETTAQDSNNRSVVFFP